MEKQQFDAFYEAHFERIYRFVFYRIGGDRERAKDLTQDIFLKAFEAFARYDPTVSRAAWIYTIARHHIINEQAKFRPGVALEEIQESIWVRQDVPARLAQNQEDRALLEAIQKLSPEDATLVRMKYLEGWTFDELAELIGKRSGALRVQALRALKKLREQLTKPNL